MSLNWDAWRELLSLAEVFGWRPVGTISNPDSGDPFAVFSYPESADAVSVNRRATYFSNDGNLVTTADATALAEAVENALGHPEQPTVKRLLGRGYTKSELEGPHKDFFESRNETLAFTCEFIDYCRACAAPQAWSAGGWIFSAVVPLVSRSHRAVQTPAVRARIR